MLTDLQIVSQVIIEKTQPFNSKVLYGGGKDMEGMDKMERKPIKITDTTLRDGHQSIFSHTDEDRGYGSDSRGIG